MSDFSNNKRLTKRLLALASLLAAAVIISYLIFVENTGSSSPPLQRVPVSDQVAEIQPSAESLRRMPDQRLQTDASAGVLDDGDSSVWRQLGELHFWQILDRHWPLAVDGDATSMVAVTLVMDACKVYRRRFAGKDIAEVRAEFESFNDPELFEVHERVWEHCGPVYDEWEEYEGWREMADLASELGQPVAMVWKSGSLLRRSESWSRGIDMLAEAAASQDPHAILQVADIYKHADTPKELYMSWIIVACRLGLDCSPDGTFMRSTCGPFNVVCGVSESVDDFLLRELGDDGFLLASTRAQRVADEITAGELTAELFRRELARPDR